MPLAFRSFFRPLALLTLALTGGLCAVVWLSQSLRFLDYIVNRGLSGTAFVKLVSLMAPSFLLVVLPLAVPLAIILLYRRLQGDSEITAWLSAGYSPWDLARPALVCASLAIILALAVSAHWLPSSYKSFKTMQTEIRSRYGAVLLQEGRFTPITDTITVYVGGRSNNGELQDLLVHDQRNPDRPVTILAKKGRLMTLNGQPVIQASNGNRQEMEAKTGRLGILFFEQYYLDLGMLITPSAPRQMELQEYPIAKLWHSTNSNYRAAGFARVILPFSCLLFAGAALWAVLLQPYRRTPNRWPLLTVSVYVLVVMALLMTALSAAVTLSILAVTFSALLGGGLLLTLLSTPRTQN